MSITFFLRFRTFVCFVYVLLNHSLFYCSMLQLLPRVQACFQEAAATRAVIMLKNPVLSKQVLMLVQRTFACVSHEERGAAKKTKQQPPSCPSATSAPPRAAGRADAAAVSGMQGVSWGVGQGVGRGAAADGAVPLVVPLAGVRGQLLFWLDSHARLARDVASLRGTMRRRVAIVRCAPSSLSGQRGSRARNAVL